MRASHRVAVVIALLTLGTVLPIVATASDSSTVQSSMRAASQHAFFAALLQHCQHRYEGASSFPTDPAHDFAGKLLVAEIAECSAEQIRIPFTVGSDRSRTWLISWQDNRLSLKHDHRHDDGTPDAVTLYGGIATSAGSPLAQAFAADAYTAQLIPAAASNVWILTLSADGRTLTYHLDRDGKPRYEAVLQKVDPQR